MVAYLGLWVVLLPCFTILAISMSLHLQIKEELKDAMRAKDEVRTTVIRSLLTGFTNELVAKKQKPDEELGDEHARAVIARAAKQRKDSIAQFEKGGRDDLAERERQELAVISAYMPAMMSREDIKKIAERKKESLGFTNPAETGKLVGALMNDLKGRADGADVKAVVEELFA